MFWNHVKIALRNLIKHKGYSFINVIGLVVFTTQQRMKEIGIRKVLGASVPNIFALISKDFLKLVCLAGCIAIPLGYYTMNQWLQKFAYKIDIQIATIALAVFAALFIAQFTVCLQSIRAALASPVETLKHE